MGKLLRLYAILTVYLGQKRQFVRRVGGMCLVLLGVHAAADILDGILFGALDIIDRWCDSLWTALLASSARDGMLTEANVVRLNEHVVGWMTPDQNEALAKFCALDVELFVEMILITLLWGIRTSSSQRLIGVRGELMQSSRERFEALQSVDLERLAIVPILLAFSLTGSLGAALAFESVCSGELAEHLPSWGYGAPLSASFALLIACGLVLRFVPDLLQGALLQSKLRASRDSPAVEEVASARFRGGSLFLARLRRMARGGLMFCTILPLAIVTLLAQQGLPALVARIGSAL